MPKLEDLRKNLSEMDRDELEAHIRQIREQRRIRKDRPQKAPKTSVANRTKASKAMAGLSADDLEALISALAEEEGSPDAGQGNPDSGH